MCNGAVGLCLYKTEVGKVPSLKRSRSKPEIYRTVDGKVVVEDELLNFLAIKIKSVSQDEIVLMAANAFGSEEIENSKNVLFELCSHAKSRNIAHRGQHKDANNIRLCLQVLNECGEDIPRFVSHYLDDLPPVSFSNLDVSCVLKRMEQLHSEVCALTRITQLQAVICEKVQSESVKMDERVSLLESPRKQALATARDSEEVYEEAGLSDQVFIYPSTGEKTSLPCCGPPVTVPTMSTAGVKMSKGLQGCSQPALTDGCSQPALTDRCSQPALTDRCSQPALTEGCSQPALTELCSQPVLTEGCSQPALTTSLNVSPLSNWSEVVKKGRPRKGSVKPMAQGGAHICKPHPVGKSRRLGTVPIVGTGSVSTIRTVKTKLVSVFATKFSPELDAETLSAYLKVQLRREVTCIKIPTAHNRFVSFKVSAMCDELSEMYCPELWPKGALVRRYYEARKTEAAGSNLAALRGKSPKNLSH